MEKGTVMEKETKRAIIIFSSIFLLVGIGILIYKKMTHTLLYPSDAKWAKNSKTLKMVDELHPKVKQDVADFFTDIEKDGLVAIGTSGLRTSAQQAGLDAGNEKNADAGLSDHEYGFAIDINVSKNGKIILRKASSTKEWNDSGVVAKAKKYKLKWGGDFKSYHDPIHFYNDFNIPAKDMPKRKLAGQVDKNGYLIV